MDGLFEAMAPFGPGAKCFFLWLIIGFFINKRIEAYNKFASWYMKTIIFALALRANIF